MINSYMPIPGNKRVPSYDWIPSFFRNEKLQKAARELQHEFPYESLDYIAYMIKNEKLGLNR